MIKVRKWGVEESTMSTEECKLNDAQLAVQYAYEFIRFDRGGGSVIIEVVDHGLFLVDYFGLKNTFTVKEIDENGAKELLAKNYN